jgi:phage tail tape-measure protein
MKKQSGTLGSIIGGLLGGTVGALTPIPLVDDIIFSWIGSKAGDWIEEKLFGGQDLSPEQVQQAISENPEEYAQRINELYQEEQAQVSQENLTEESSEDLSEGTADVELPRAAYTQLEGILKKIAFENNIDGVRSISINLNDTSGLVRFRK